MTTSTLEKNGVGQCKRCGTCCLKGGPALHEEDQHLVENGQIALKDLFTIRQGEPAYDNVTGDIQPAETDIIKISAEPGQDPACRFYQYVRSECAIYAHRPIECRVLQCWDPQPLIRLYHHRRLTRRHLLSKIDGLWDLVRDHHSTIDYGRIESLADSIKKRRGHEPAQRQLLELIRYDQSLRAATRERTGYDTGMLSFLLGRPLAGTIRLFRLRLVRKGCEYTLEPHM